MQNRVKALFSNVLLFAISCGLFAVSANSAPKKKKSSTSTVTTACVACLNALDPQSLEFTIDPVKCPKRLANCYKTDYTSRCEGIIQDCIQANCTASDSCGDVAGNRSLFYGCLKAENLVLPYQCKSYIIGVASSKASEVQAAIEKRNNETSLRVAQANNEAEQAKAQADLKAKQIAEEEETKRKQIEADNKLKLQQDEARLKQQEIERQRKAEQDAKNNRPSVKYNSLLNDVKQAIASAKNYTSKAYNMLGITEGSGSSGNIIFFAPSSVKNEPLGIYFSSDKKAKSLVNASRYNNIRDYICTKDVKESVIKAELNNVYNLLKAANEKLATGISEIEINNVDGDIGGAISESKIDELYSLQDLLMSGIGEVETQMAKLKTSCETRCAGLSTFSVDTSSSGGVEFDENGLIVEKKSSGSGDYSCKDFDNVDDKNPNDIIAMFTGGGNVGNSPFMGIGDRVKELTENVVKAVLDVDRKLDEMSIRVQLKRFDDDVEDNSGEINSCVQYMVLDIASYVSCASNVLGQQLTALANQSNNSSIKEKLVNTIKNIIDVLKSPNYSSVVGNDSFKCKMEDGSCENNKACCEDCKLLNATGDYNDFKNCALSLTSSLNKIKNVNVTGKFNFTVTNLKKLDDKIYIGTSDGGINDPNSFTKDKLGWSDVKNCSVVLDSSQTTFDYWSNGASKTIDGINIGNSVLDCTCNDGTTKQLFFSQINMGVALGSCSQKQSGN